MSKIYTDMLDTVQSRTTAIKNLSSLDLNKYVGSGFIINITDLNGKVLVDSVVGTTTDEETAKFATIRNTLIDVLKENLSFSLMLIKNYTSEAEDLLR